MGFWNKSPTLPLNQGLYEKSLYEIKGFMKKKKTRLWPFRGRYLLD